MKKGSAASMAFGGVLGALAVMIQYLGGFIPIATYLCPGIAILLCWLVARQCGSRVTWAWYAAVAVLSLLLGPNKEAAGVFLVLGYYPILKPRLDAAKLGWLGKLLVFNVGVCALYGVMIYVSGLEEVIGENEGLGAWMLVILLVMGNITFFLLDFLLTLLERRAQNMKKSKRPNTGERQDG